jgi:hypothetical protein
MYRRRHSSALDIRSFMAADCDTDPYLGLAEVRERLAVRGKKKKKRTEFTAH